MKQLAIKSLAVLLALGMLGAAGIGDAQAAHGRVRIGIGVGIGPGWGPWGPWYYPPAYYYPPYYPPVVVMPAAPPVYVEQPAAVPVDPGAAGNYWYYCAVGKGYYPYIKECPSGWQRVAPQPSPQ